MDHSKTLKLYQRKRKVLSDSRFSHTLETIMSGNKRQVMENKRFLAQCDKRIAFIDKEIAKIKQFASDMRRGLC